MSSRTFFIALLFAFFLYFNSNGAQGEVPTEQKLTSAPATDGLLSEYKWVPNLPENELLETGNAGNMDGGVHWGADEKSPRENKEKEKGLAGENSLDRSISAGEGGGTSETSILIKVTADVEEENITETSQVLVSSDDLSIGEETREVETVSAPGDGKGIANRSGPLIPQEPEIFALRAYVNGELVLTEGDLNKKTEDIEMQSHLKRSQKIQEGCIHADESLTNSVGAFDPISKCDSNNQSQGSTRNEIQDSKLMIHLQESENHNSGSTALQFPFERQQSSLSRLSPFSQNKSVAITSLDPLSLAFTEFQSTSTASPSASQYQLLPDQLVRFSENTSLLVPENTVQSQLEPSLGIFESSSTSPATTMSLFRSAILQFTSSTSETIPIPFETLNLIQDKAMAFRSGEAAGSQELNSFQVLLNQNFEHSFNGKEGSLLRYQQIPIAQEQLNFEPLPGGDNYEMEKLGVTDGIFVFTYLGDFLSFVQPHDFPVEFVRDAIWKKLSVVTVIMQSLQVEAGFVTCLVVGIFLSLVVPITSTASTCSSLCRPNKKLSDSVSMSGNSQINCNRRSLVVTLFFIVLFIGAGLTAMIVTNEQLSSAVLQTPRVLTAGLNDAATFVRNTQNQISHVTLNNLDNTLNAIHADLDDVEKLLGEPIQKEIAGETGVDVALDALVDVALVAEGLAQKVSEMQQVGFTMRDLSSEAKERLMDLRNQVDSVRRTCPSRDRPLCDTIDSSGLDVVFRADGLNSDPRLNILRSLSVGKLPQLAQRMRRRFSDVPVDIAHETKDIRESIKRDLNRHKSSVDEKIWPLENLARDVRLKINGAREYAVFFEEGAAGVEQWRWLSIFVICLLVMLIWCLLASALVYSCCDGEEKARSLLIASLAVSSLLSVILWAVALVCFIVGGHGEVFICRPLYDQPTYKSLTELLDDPGILYQRGGGFIRNLLPRNQSLNVPLRKILAECEHNKAAYEAFEMKNVLDLESATDFREWDDIFSLFQDLNKNYTQLQFLDPELQEKLHNLLQATAVNMTSHRSQISKPITGKDLTSFAKQLDSVANQIKDLSTASRIETLASRTRRLITANIQPLEEKKEELLYLVTALDVQISPLQRQVNQSISHLKTIQYYIDNQGANISTTKTVQYTSRLRNYLEQYREQLLQGLSTTAAPCQPIWNVFNALRHQMCRQVMDPLNGFWFALVWCLFWLLVATPVSIKLIHYFVLYKDGLLTSSNSSSVTSNERGAAWNSPESVEVDNPNW